MCAGWLTYASEAEDPESATIRIWHERRRKWYIICACTDRCTLEELDGVYNIAYVNKESILISSRQQKNGREGLWLAI